MSLLALNCAADDRPVRSAPRLVPPVRPDVGELRWHVLLTEPQRELMAVEHIGLAVRQSAWGIPKVDLYCPQFPQRRLSGRKMRERMVCMFPGYLLAKLPVNFHAWHVIAGARGMRDPCMLTVDCHGARVPVTVPTWEMQVIMEVEATLQGTPSARPDALRVGQQVRITDGPLAWLYGTIESLVKLDTQGRVRVAADLFGRLVPVELECDQFEAT